MKKNSAFYFLIYYGFEQTVIESQVLTPVSRLKNEGLKITLIFMESFPKWVSFIFGGKDRQRFNTIKNSPITVFPRIPKNFLLLNSILIFLSLIPDLLTKKTLVFQARGFQGTDVLLKLKRMSRKIKVICDVRGLESAEYEFFVNKHFSFRGFLQKIWLNQLKMIERKAIFYADRFFCVSRYLIAKLKESANNPDFECLYTPCAVEVEKYSQALTQRDLMRKKLGVDGKMVILYSGAIGRWHLTDKVIQLFKWILDFEPNAFFLGLTPSAEKLTEMLRESLVPEKAYKILLVAFPEIPEYLAAADIGLLLRKKDPLNLYSFPTKFGEYLAAGLHVVTTDAIFDVREIIQTEKAGTILSNLDDPLLCVQDLKNAVNSAQQVSDRISISTGAAAKYLSWDLLIPQIKKTYQELAQ